MRQTDLIIIGAGPAGLAAASEAANGGAQVVLLDEQPTLGGQVYRNILGATAKQQTILGPDYTAGRNLAQTVLEAKVDYRPCATIWKVSLDGTVIYSQNGSSHTMQGRHILLVTGALERPVPLPGWTLPGVLTAGAAQILLKSGGLAASNAVLAGSGPLLYLVAQQMIKAGFAPKALIETQTRANMRAAMAHVGGALIGWRNLTKGLGLITTIRKAGVPRFKGATNIQIEGTDKAKAISFDVNGQTNRIVADTFLLHQGVIPNTQITRSLGLEHRWDEKQHCFHPVSDRFGQTSADNISVAGDGAGILGTKAAQYSGRIAALDVLARLKLIGTKDRDLQAHKWLSGRNAEAAIRPFLDTLYTPPSEILRPTGKTTVCRCEEVTAEEIRGYVALGCRGPNQTKAFSRCGMGPCQGRYCGSTVTELLADELNLFPDGVGSYRIRSPLKPVTLGELASLEQDKNISLTDHLIMQATKQGQN